MLEQENIMITEDDYLTLYVVGYEEQGESIILSIGDKFLGVIDCFKVKDRFETKRIIREKGIPIDFICWTHADWDHTYGLAELKDYCNQNTAIIIPEGLEAKDIRELFFDSKSYQHKEYNKIYAVIDDVQPKKFVSANEHSRIYRFMFKYKDEEIEFIMNSFAPYGWMVRDLNRNFISNLVRDISFEENKKTIGYKWYENGNSKNNIFSVGLEIILKLKNEDIRICLTGDLDNETIKEMGKGSMESIFSRNTILKIPHHGSKNSDELLEFSYSDKIKYNYAICTSYKKASLPNNDMISNYKKNGRVFKTNYRDSNKYGLITYRIPLVSTKIIDESFEEIICEGDAGEVI